VVTGSAIGAPERPLTVALDVIRGRDIEQRGQTTLSTVFDGSVPGVWVWEQAPTAILARYGSIRGASSFGVSYPKVYVDGIEVANPLLLTQLTPENIERVEVIRGPQGAALYGSDAISGVVNIVSRQDGGSSEGARTMVRSEGGYSAGLATSAVQSHTLSRTFGSTLRSASATVGYATSGAYIPQAYSRDLRFAGNAKFVGSKSTLMTSVRVAAKDAGIPVSPLISKRFATDSEPQALRSYTVGATMNIVPTEVWTYALTAGVDGYHLDNVASELLPVPFFVDSTLRSASGSALRGTLRASAVARVGTPGRVSGTLTFAGEHSTLRDRTLRTNMQSWATGAGSYDVDWSTNMGFTQQVDLAFHNTAYVTAGIRQERVLAPVGISQYRLLPMLGGAVVRDLGGITAKARLAYGKGIRSPASVQRVRVANKRRLFNPFLSPEEQSGVEGGVDLLFGSRFGVHITRFDQLAFGLIQDVLIGDTSSSGPGTERYGYQLQNVGEISNRGWETQATAAFGSVSLAAAMSTVRSRVEKLASTYNGDLLAGGRMLGVPARTLSGTVNWTRRGFQFSTTLSRASDWVNYDRLAIAECIVVNHTPPKGGCPDADSLSQGSTLRKYWMTYGGNTRLRATSAFDLGRGMTLTATGENLFNQQRGEPDSITIVPGRTLTVGLRARF